MILELKTEMKKEDIDQRLQNFFESKGYEVVYKDGKHRICRIFRCRIFFCKNFHFLRLKKKRVTLVLPERCITAKSFDFAE